MAPLAHPADLRRSRHGVEVAGQEHGDVRAVDFHLAGHVLLQLTRTALAVPGIDGLEVRGAEDEKAATVDDLEG